MNEPMRTQILAQGTVLRALVVRRAEIGRMVAELAGGARRIWAVGTATPIWCR